MNFDVIVIGAGHAGCEAAAASARLGVKTCLITFSESNVGELSCNPSIGGVGKGIIVKEVDALDGVMPKVADIAGIHYKTLNRSRGPAVWGPRAQADRELYRNGMQSVLSQYENLTTLYGEVVDIILEDINGKTSAAGVKYIPNGEKSPIEIRSKSTVLTTGTFLGGLIHVGTETVRSGRYGEQASLELAEKLKTTGIEIARLKTGTPPRLRRSSIDFSVLEAQPGDDFPLFFSHSTKGYLAPQISCYITYTSSETHQIIRDNINLSPMYSGQISSTGPRYCPSIEDKIMRFADKERHQLFLEPEGVDCDVVYPNGISTSLPKDVQEKIIRSIKGLEDVEILRYGYAIEYDYFNPKQLNYTLESKVIDNLYLAGQINGTTGYEEAAGQGLIAGTNAALKLSDRSFTLTRGDAYIGVMIDDLITKGVTEPYRMMTSRAEFRLSMRYDNAIDRLSNKGSEVGLISSEMQNHVEAGKKLSEETFEKAKMYEFNNTSEFHTVKYKNLAAALGQVGVDLDPILLLENFSREEVLALQKIHGDRLYESYASRQAKEIERLNSDKLTAIPDDIDYTKISSLSNEVRAKISRFKPKTILELQNIEGITPAAVIAIQIYIKKLSST